MATISKQETVQDFINKTYSKHNISFQENSVTLTYDFIIDKSTAKVIIKIEQKRWENSDSNSIIEYLQSKEQKILNALSTNESDILSIK